MVQTLIYSKRIRQLGQNLHTMTMMRGPLMTVTQLLLNRQLSTLLRPLTEENLTFKLM